jgi:ribosomal protein L3
MLFCLQIQLGLRCINKPAEGHAKKADAAPKRFIREFRNVDVDAYEVGLQNLVLCGNENRVT